jgi:hypothetical protein
MNCPFEPGAIIFKSGKKPPRREFFTNKEWARRLGTESALLACMNISLCADADLNPKKRP